MLAKGDQQRIWAYHDGVDLGGPAMVRIARDYGYTWIVKECNVCLHGRGGLQRQIAVRKTGQDRLAADDKHIRITGDR